MIPRVRALLTPRPTPRQTPRLALLFVVGIAALAFASAWGCATVLGFEDTTLRSDGDADLREGGSTEGGPLDEGGVRPDGGTSRLTTQPTSLVVRRGATADLVVDLARSSDVTGAVTIRLSALPAGVTATTATLAPGVTTGTVKISAAANAALGAQTITVNADGTTLPAALVPLLVADPAGSLDTTFDTDGLSSDATRGAGSTFRSLALQPDGMIVAAGAAGATPGSLSGWILRRYATSGAADAPFTNKTGAAGVLPTDGEAQAVAIDAKGNIVCAGFSQAAPLQQLTVVRLLPTGALDTTFAGGVVRVPAEVAATASFAYGVAVQPDGAVVVVGARRDLGSNESGIIIRFKENGTRDATFNGGTTVVMPAARFVGVAIDAGAVLVAGSTIGGALPSYFATRRTSTGAVDPTFGSGGTAAFGNTYRANGFARLSDGSIALVGDVQQGAAGYTAGLATAKGTAVFARAYANAAGAGFFGIGVQADGRIIAAGHTAVTNGEARVERILADGNADMTFGTAGTATLEQAGTVNGIDVTLFSAAVQKDGRILAAGNRSNAGATIYRLWP
jgi:uncharacterized delta-60 repeat protein